MDFIIFCLEFHSVVSTSKLNELILTWCLGRRDESPDDFHINVHFSEHQQK